MGNSAALRDMILDRTLLALEELHLSLHTGDPGDTGASEVRGGDYRRESVTLRRLAAGTATNVGAIEVRGLPAGTITHFGIWTSERGGNFLLGGALQANQPVLEGQGIRWDAGQLVVSVG